MNKLNIFHTRQLGIGTARRNRRGGAQLTASSFWHSFGEPSKGTAVIRIAPNGALIRKKFDIYKRELYKGKIAQNFKCVNIIRVKKQVRNYLK